MRADRLLAILMLLRHRGRLTAGELAAELEVSVRTVLRDVEALSAAGVPVYTDRGRGGGISLLPGYRTDLTGLTLDEAKALLASASGRVHSPAFASAMRKVAAALPEPHRAAATQAAERILVLPEGFARPRAPEPLLGALQQAVFDGVRIRVRYRARGSDVAERVLDPVGLVHAGEVWYLLARRDGADRTYRVSRFESVEPTGEPTDRPATVDLAAAFEASRASFRETLHDTVVTVLIDPKVRDMVARTIIEIIDEAADADGRIRIRARFGGEQHLLRTLWSLGPTVELLDPPAMRQAIAARAAATLEHYGDV
ncbi:helix-turn-helix transcriptional regulator [Tsukamurella soli]|uniref:YafY family protein n=1 Tax=Tsukamurella soli TaxID=644556 RepID=A0ABP8JFQ9_9ACTN